MSSSSSSVTEESQPIPADLIGCIQKLLSSVSTLSKHLLALTVPEYRQNQGEQVNIKLKAIKEAIDSLAPAIETALQVCSTSPFVDRLSNDYARLCEDYKKLYSITMTETRPFAEYKQYIEHLSSWLTSTNANINEVLQSVNKQRALLIIKNLDELSKYKSLLERATILNRKMVADLPDEQAIKMTNEIADVKEQWQILIDGLNTLKERHASRLSSPEPMSSSTSSITSPTTDRLLMKQNENLVHYIESWLTMGRQLVNQQEQMILMMMINNNNNNNTVDEKDFSHASSISFNKTESVSDDLLFQLKECEQEIHRLHSLLDENCRMSRTSDIPGEVTRTLKDELTVLAERVTTARIQLENRIQQNRCFLVELDSLTDWLSKFVTKTKTIDSRTIQLALSERQQHFDDVIKCAKQNNDNRVKDKIENLISMWTQLASATNSEITDSSTVSTAQPSSTLIDNEHEVLDRARKLLNKIVQLGNQQEIDELRNTIKSFLAELNVSFSNNEENMSSSLSPPPNLKSNLLDQLCTELANRQSTLTQMLIDTSHIDRLRVNFVAHFNTTENNNATVTAVNEMTTILDKYPKETTSQLRQWIIEQQNKITAPLATVDASKSIDDFNDYIKEIETSIVQFQQEKNSNDETKLKLVLQQMEDRPHVPQNLNSDDRQRIAHLQQRFLQAQSQIEEIRRHSTMTNLDGMIDNIDQLIKNVRNMEEQIRANAIQPISDYDRLINDCQRIITELDQTLRVNVEQAINSGKRLYTSDSKDSSGVESADETGGSSSSPSPLLKKQYSDLTLRKVRRHVLQLTQRWKSANINVRHRLKVLQRAQTAVEELRRKCDQLHAHLLEIELAYAHQPQIRALNAEQVPAEIEQAKHLLTTLMSCKGSIDDVQQLATNIENEYDIHATSRAQELNQRWDHSMNSVSQRIQLLQDSLRHSDAGIYSSSVEHPWQRSIASNQVPYYINHSDQSTSWDHPKMLELMRSFSNLNDIRFSAYRTAMKLRTLQKRLCLDLTSLSDVISVFEENPSLDSPTKDIDKHVNVTEILAYLQTIFEKTAAEYPKLINVILTVDLTLNWLLNIYDTNRTGTIRLLAMKMALALLCRGNIEEKYRYIFSLASVDKDGCHVIDRQHLSTLFQQAIVIPKQLGEVAAFGGSSVEPSVKSCFDYAHNPEAITADEFLDWVKLEPQSLVWLPVMHRLAASEAAKHEARCNICKIYPILGFRYRSLKHFNCDICQNCFFSGKQTKFFKMDDPLQEYYTETTSSEDIRDFFRIFKNKLWTKHRKHPKLGYLPLPHVFDNTNSTNQQPTSPTPISSVITRSTPFRSEIGIVQPLPSSAESDDEHGIIAQHCRNLNSFVHSSPRVAAHEVLSRSKSLDHEQRNELEAIIHDLEDENRLLQNEYERLCQQHLEKTMMINEQQQHDSMVTYHPNDREMLREAKQLRHHKTKLEQRMKILEEHNKQLEQQLRRSKQLLLRESPSSLLRYHPHHHHHTGSSSSMLDHRTTPTPSPLHTSMRRSIERNLERQPNLITIDNLFHMADDINRAVGDLVSVITEPQSNTSSSSYYQHMDTSIVT